MTTTSDEQITQIDAAINAAKGKAGTPAPTPPGEEKPKRKRLSPEERAARDELRAKEKAEKKAAREKAREAKKAEKEANRKPPHMSKVEKAASKLPPMSEGAQKAFGALTGKLSSGDLFSLTENLKHHIRVAQTQGALQMSLKVGQVVKIVSGNPRFVNQTATVMKVQRIRCYVEVPGYNKPVYLFTTDCQPLDADEVNTVTEEQLAAKAS